MPPSLPPLTRTTGQGGEISSPPPDNGYQAPRKKKKIYIFFHRSKYWYDNKIIVWSVSSQTQQGGSVSVKHKHSWPSSCVHFLLKNWVSTLLTFSISALLTLTITLTPLHLNSFTLTHTYFEFFQLSRASDFLPTTQTSSTLCWCAKI